MRNCVSGHFIHRQTLHKSRLYKEPSPNINKISSSTCTSCIMHHDILPTTTCVLSAGSFPLSTLAHGSKYSRAAIPQRNKIPPTLPGVYISFSPFSITIYRQLKKKNPFSCLGNSGPRESFDASIIIPFFLFLSCPRNVSRCNGVQKTSKIPKVPSATILLDFFFLFT